MTISHKIDDFLFAIFPKLKGGGNLLIIATLETYYTYGSFKPKVAIDKDWITIEIDTKSIIALDEEFKKTVTLCEKGKYSEAKPILQKLIEKNPTNSEYYRIMGQILSDEGDQDEAINYLIDALRWNSSNGWALLMMGNIFAKFKNDVPTAMKYYDQAVKNNATDNISLTNIGYLLFQQNKLEEAKKYLWEAIRINNEYPNSHLTLALIAQKENDLHSAFYSTIQAIKLSKNNDVLYQNSVKQAFEIATQISETTEGKKLVKQYLHKLEFDGGTEIETIEDSEIATAAKIEFAENYDRPKHIVKFKPGYPAVEHLIMHELVHLDFIIEARKNELNQLFISTQQHKAQFLKTIEPSIKNLQKMGLPQSSITKYCDSLFHGLNLQIYNTPIDLLIENFIYDEHAELRPFQFMSLYALIQEGLKAVTDKNVLELSPKDIISKSKIYNLVNAIQYKALYGIDFMKEFNATLIELKQANQFYDEYLQYKDDKEPAEEYEMVLHWAEDLKLDKNFELVNEQEYRTKRTDIDNLLSSIENDPYDLESKDPYKQREMDKFQKSQESIGTNMAVVMFMVDALNYFENKPVEDIKQIAFEIATQGTQGFSPNKTDYIISFIPNKLFTGYHIMAYYYVSWALAIPEMLAQLNLPFDEEYKLAKGMKNKI